MDEAVIHNNVRAGTPLYYSNDVIYNSIAVDTLTYNQSYDVYFLGTGMCQLRITLYTFALDASLFSNRSISINSK